MWDGRNLVHAPATDHDLGSNDMSLFEYQLRRPLRLQFHLDRVKLFSFWVD